MSKFLEDAEQDIWQFSKGQEDMAAECEGLKCQLEAIERVNAMQRECGATSSNLQTWHEGARACDELWRRTNRKDHCIGQRDDQQG